LNAQTIFQNIALSKPVAINNQNFYYTGGIQKFVVPNRVTAIQVTAVGAKGGTGGNGQVGGAGANLTTTLNVTSGQILYIVVGGFSGQSATAKYGYGGNGGIANSGSAFGGAGGGLSGVFTSSSPAIANALIVAGGGGGGGGHGTGTDYTGGNAGNTSAGASSNGNEPAGAQTGYVSNGRYQYGYAASNSGPGGGGYAYDNYPGNNGGAGSDINGGVGGTGTIWAGGGGGGGGFYGGGGGAGGGDAEGGGAGGATKSTGSVTTYGAANSSGDGSVIITCISNSGLVLNLDAGNTNSYNGSGSTWNDLSGNGNNASLVSTSYNSSNGGYLIFDGTNSYVDFSANVSTATVVTVEMWANVTNVGASNMNGMMFGFNTYDAWTNSGNLGYNCGNGVLYGINSTTFSNYWSNWQHYVFVMYAGDYNSSNKIYINKVSQTMGIPIPGSGWNAPNAVFGTGIGRISGWRIDNGYKINMKVASFRIYNRELTAQEITNNYNAQKSRFGL
jgi:hypothetical protein